MPDRLADVSLTDEQVLAGGVRLHAVTAGDPGDPLVVCLHGFPGFWYDWRRQVPALVEAGYRVVAPDLRGYNESEKPPGVESYAVAELAGDVAGLIREFGDGSARVVGHDWGGTIAWRLGIERPDVLDRLVVLNAPHPAALAERFDRAQLKRSSYALSFQLPWLPERLLRLGNCRAVAGILREGAANPDAFTDADIERYREAFCRPGVARAALNYYRAYARYLARPLLERKVPVLRRFDDPLGETEVPVPTLLLWGERDPALCNDLSVGLAEWVPSIRVERFPEASHWVQLDAPERVSERLVSFLEEGRG